MKLETVRKTLEISMSKEELAGYITTLNSVLNQLTDSEYKTELSDFTTKLSAVLADARDY